MYRHIRYSGDSDPLKVAEWVRQEFAKLEQSFFDLDMIQFKVTTVAPEKPREGMTLLADGTLWNPGAGKGVYTYYSGVWNKLG
jgi:hypothetical protein